MAHILFNCDLSVPERQALNSSIRAIKEASNSLIGSLSDEDFAVFNRMRDPRSIGRL